jgi:hypothetical protein
MGAPFMTIFTTSGSARGDGASERRDEPVERFLPTRGKHAAEAMQPVALLERVTTCVANDGYPVFQQWDARGWTSGGTAPQTGEKLGVPVKPVTGMMRKLLHDGGSLFVPLRRR